MWYRYNFGSCWNNIDSFFYDHLIIIEAQTFANEIGAIFQETKFGFWANTLFENIGRTYLIPGYNYKKPDKKMEEKL